MLLPVLYLAAMAVSALAGSSAEAATSLPERGEGFLQFEVTAREVVPSDSQTPKRQQGPVGLGTKRGLFYFIYLYIGTPPQLVGVILDTGSADLFVNPKCATSGDQQACEGLGQFDYSRSSTAKLTGYESMLSFFQGNVLVVWAADTVAIGCSSGSSSGCTATTGAVTNQYFGIGVDSSRLPYGALGLSPPLSGPQQHPYFLDNLVSQKLIASRAFSLDLRLGSGSTGSIVFGGVDTGKFIGALEKCPMLDPSQTPDKSNRYWITMNGIGITTPQGLSQSKTGLNVPVFIDSGNSLTMLPQDIFWGLGQAFPNSMYDPTSGNFVVDCGLMGQPGTVNFFFNNKVISVPYSEFIVDQGVPTGQQGPCVLGMKPTTGIPTLGDTFLRAAYVVYDQENRILHLAQAADCGSNVVVIGTGPDAVPSSTGMCPASSTVAATSTADLATESPTILYSGKDAIPTTEYNGAGPQTGATSVPGSTFPTVCTTCSVTVTAPGGGTVTGGGSLPTTTSGGAAAAPAFGGVLLTMALAVLLTSA